MPTDIQLSPASFPTRSLLGRANHPSYGPITAYLVGDLLGCLDNSGSIIHDQSSVVSYVSDYILSASDLAKVSLLPFVGSFSIVILLHDQSEIYLCVSCTSPSPYVFLNGNTLSVDFDENKLLKHHKYDLSIDSLVNISLSHQLVVRYPTQLFDLPGYIRCPSGHNTRVFIGSKRVKYYPYLNDSPDSFSPSRLRNSLSSILSLYYTSYGSELGLLFSGGLDSSCLASSLQSANISLPYFHIDYKGDVSPRSSVASYISSFFGSPTSHLSRFSTSVRSEEIIRQCKAGLMTVPNPMYFGVPINLESVKCLPKYLITGQGADSIYVIDGFAPPTESIGSQRVKQIISSAPDRLALCESYIRHKLSYNQHHVDSSLLNSSIFSDFVFKQCCDLLEHVDYTEYTKSSQKSPASLERLEYIAKPVLSLISSYIQSSSNHISISSIYRYIKWMRSLINCPQQDASALLSQSVQRLTPYLEGPIVGLFFGYKLREYESISIKHELESLFIHQTDVSHRHLVELALSQPLSLDTCGEKLFTSASSNHIKKVQSEVLRSLSQDLNSHPHADRLSGLIKDATQLVRVAPLL
tara:strand:- start:11742 stop:13487 length:1746 start_codon:yes stop_codon:yes gene_type:complete